MSCPNPTALIEIFVDNTDRIKRTVVCNGIMWSIRYDYCYTPHWGVADASEAPFIRIQAVKCLNSSQGIGEACTFEAFRPPMWAPLKMGKPHINESEFPFWRFTLIRIL